MFTICSYAVILGIEVKKLTRFAARDTEENWMPDTVTVICALALTAGCALLGRSFLMACEQKNYDRAFWLKGAAGLCFAALGLMMARGAVQPDYARRVCIGLFLGLTGDELLAMRFLRPARHDEFFSAGATAFAAGHILYIWALLSLSGARLVSALPVFIIGYSAALVYGYFRKVDAGRLTPCAMAYIALVVFMGATAGVAAVRTFSVGTLMFAAAGVCFSVSDCILCAYCYGSRKTTGMNVAVHATYYGAQLLIAWSIALV